MDLTTKLIITISLFLLSISFNIIIRRVARRTKNKYGLKQNRYNLIKKVINLLTILIIIPATLYIWGVDIKNAWIALSSFLTLFAIGFIAVWSVLSNVLAGFILYFVNIFKIDDSIELLPDEIKGKVKVINLFYVELITASGDSINVPNSLFFQKYVKKINNIKGRRNKK